MSEKFRRRDYHVRLSTLPEVSDLVISHHYARSHAKVASVATALVRVRDGALVGCALFMVPASPNVCRYAAKRMGLSPSGILTLSRLVVCPEVPTNGASFLIGGSLRLIPEPWSGVITYADQLQNHSGAIYRASNWVYDGEARARHRWEDGDGRIVAAKASRTRTVSEMASLGLTKVAGKPKHRFLYRLR